MQNAHVKHIDRASSLSEGCMSPRSPARDIFEITTSLESFILVRTAGLSFDLARISRLLLRGPAARDLQELERIQARRHDYQAPLLVESDGDVLAQ